jgi:endo-1,3(4)-beta-glucanase
MDRYQICLRVLHLLSLIAILQVSATWSYPFGASNQGTDEAPDPDCSPEPPPAVPYVSSSSVYEYIAPEEYTTNIGYNWQPTAYVVGDGQVQAAYPVSTEVVAVAASGSTILSSSVVTSYYTPLPRQDTTDRTSTSTTTVFVLPSPSPSPLVTSSVTTSSHQPTAAATSDTPKPNPTTNIPDNSLTSLTTSEVQTLTEAPITNTSGVSRHLHHQVVH